MYNMGIIRKTKVDRGETRHLQVTKHNNYHLPQIIYGLVCEENSSVLTFCLFTLYLLSLIGTIILLHVCDLEICSMKRLLTIKELGIQTPVQHWNRWQKLLRKKCTTNRTNGKGRKLCAYLLHANFRVMLCTLTAQSVRYFILFKSIR